MPIQKMYVAQIVTAQLVSFRGASEWSINHSEVGHALNFPACALAQKALRGENTRFTHKRNGT
jgi:hypothetical protein